jgi:hypothetical protein
VYRLAQGEKPNLYAGTSRGSVAGGGETLGGMFWLSANTFSGSHSFLSATSRSNFSSP